MSVVDTVACTVEEAEQLTQKLAHSLTESWQLLREAFVKRVWEPLGYDSWDAYCADRLSTNTVRLAPEWRKQVVAELSSGEHPMSNHAIAAGLGVSKDTVRRDRVQSATGANAPVVQHEPPDDVIDAEVVGDVVHRQPEPEPPKQKRLGIDGRERSVPRPRPRKSQPGTRRTHLQILQIMTTEKLPALARMADEIKGAGLDSSVTAEEAARLMGDLILQLRSLGRIKRLLEERSSC